MLCYQTRYEDGVFTGVLIADEDPMVSGRYVLPGACVWDAPPAYEGGRQARWTGESWMIEDAPPIVGMRGGKLYGVQIKWDGTDFEGILVEAPAVQAGERSIWTGKIWRVETAWSGA